MTDTTVIDSNVNDPTIVYSTLKLEQVAARCGSTVSGTVLGQLLADPRYTRYQIASALSTSLEYFEMEMAQPEPIVYPPLTTQNVGDAA